MTPPTAIAVTAATLATTGAGWAAAGTVGGAAGLAVGLVVGVLPCWGRPPWSWGLLWWRRNRPFDRPAPVTATNDRSGAGVRYQDGVAAVAVQVLGRAHRPTRFTGSAAAATDNTLDVAALPPLLRQSLGLRLASLSLVSTGARRGTSGNYPALYDTLLGTPPYAGRRETWLIARLPALPNAEALRWRESVGAAAVAAGQRIAAALRERGIRARTATATDIAELELRLGCSALAVGNRGWRALRGEPGWLSSYDYTGPLTADGLGRPWSLRVDGVSTNLTVFADRTVAVTVTVRTAQPPSAPPSTLLRALPGLQAQTLAAALCGPATPPEPVARRRLPATLAVPVGPSGVLLGKTDNGCRLLLPFDDPVHTSRVTVAADDAVTKRLIVRLAGAGERITVHTTDAGRWSSLRMPAVTVTDRIRPAAGSTISVVDGTVAPAPRPATTLVVGADTARTAADVAISQTGPDTLEVRADGQTHRVQMELFRAEDRYAEPGDAAARRPVLHLVE
ncbi:type VII secretion protein EccE [Mycobacterium sp. 1274756.6]|uniref:type VII secretion protein EccE n=1 Tax=Mycobacterium sp. 1274756.6 TaxID=1834076 RepID=UPI0007FDE87F|nr:type VII secretion protein EccE [Mycobacterium sp. 1274756.6]OBJ67499.1 type VII secretion protein EccE [Mycobacterium sp. 1274756.6]